MHSFGHRSSAHSLVCVGGMPRFVQQSPATQAASPAAATANGKASASAITPFGAFTSPFTASTPSVAPTTPLPSSLTPMPFHRPSSLTPCTSVEASLSPVTEMHTPRPTSFASRTESANGCVSNPASKTTCQLLTPKQVRELRRLCRKTANRAEFEHRHIQIRQVASIYAMASSSLHLFDPDNPLSGRDLQVWVDSHRENGADWRDEHLLSLSAIAELRRWDRLLKAWAHSRVHDPRSDVNRSGSSAVTSRYPVDARAALQPVRLQFEQLSVEPTPITPQFHRKQAMEHQPSEAVASRSGMRPTNALHSPCTSLLGTSVARAAHEGAGDRAFVSSQSLLRFEPALGVAADGSPKTASSWGNASFTNPRQSTDNRQPFVEVSFNSMTDLINVTVPKTKEPAKSSRYIAHDLGYPLDMNNMSPFNKENSPYASCSKPWRSAMSESANPGAQDNANTKYANRSFCLTPGKWSDAPACSFTRGVGMNSSRPLSNSHLDWASLRGGRTWDKDAL